MEMIYNIPEVVGWGIVGMMAIGCGILIAKLVKIGMEIYRDYKEL